MGIRSIIDLLKKRLILARYYVIINSPINKNLTKECIHMKKIVSFILITAFLLCLIGCGKQTPEQVKTIESDLKTYYELSDGSWECDGHIYKYRLEISGRMPNAAVDSTFVYLSNQETISFEQAYLAAGISSDLNDYFSVEDAVLVDMKTK